MQLTFSSENIEDSEIDEGWNLIKVLQKASIHTVSNSNYVHCDKNKGDFVKQSNPFTNFPCPKSKVYLYL